MESKVEALSLEVVNQKLKYENIEENLHFQRLSRTFRAPDFTLWTKKDAWVLHHAIALINGIDPECFYSMADYLYYLNNMDRIFPDQLKTLGDLVPYLVKFEKIFLEAHDCHLAGTLQTVCGWKNHARVLIKPWVFLQWAEKHGHHIPEELRGIEPHVETVATVTTGGDDPAPATVTINIEGIDLENFDPENEKTLATMRAMSKENRARIAKSMNQAGKTRKEIAEKVFCYKLHDKTATLKSCMRNVTDLLK
ncbi:hypothetical protein [Desulfonatronum parangueonense]